MITVDPDGHVYVDRKGCFDNWNFQCIEFAANDSRPVRPEDLQSALSRWRTV